MKINLTEVQLKDFVESKLTNNEIKNIIEKTTRKYYSGAIHIASKLNNEFGDYFNSNCSSSFVSGAMNINGEMVGISFDTNRYINPTKSKNDKSNWFNSNKDISVLTERFVKSWSQECEDRLIAGMICVMAARNAIAKRREGVDYTGISYIETHKKLREKYDMPVASIYKTNSDEEVLETSELVEIKKIEIKESINVEEKIEMKNINNEIKTNVETKKLPISRSYVMSLAHELRRSNNIEGSYREQMSICIKKAWAIAKEEDAAEEVVEIAEEVVEIVEEVVEIAEEEAKIEVKAIEPAEVKMPESVAKLKDTTSVKKDRYVGRIINNGSEFVLSVLNPENNTTVELYGKKVEKRTICAALKECHLDKSIDIIMDDRQISMIKLDLKSKKQMKKGKINILNENEDVVYGYENI